MESGKNVFISHGTCLVLKAASLPAIGLAAEFGSREGKNDDAPLRSYYCRERTVELRSPVQATCSRVFFSWSGPLALENGV